MSSLPQPVRSQRRGAAYPRAFELCLRSLVSLNALGTPIRPMHTVDLGCFVRVAELAAIASILGRLPTPAEYLQNFGNLSATAADTYRYLNFDQLPEYVKSASNVDIPQDLRDAAKKHYA